MDAVKRKIFRQPVSKLTELKPSDTRQYSVKTAKHILKLFSP